MSNRKADQIPLSVPEMGGNEWKYIKECIDTGWVSHAGSFVCEFERKIAKYVGSKYAIACINGTSALHISLLLAGVNPGDEVIVPALTFIAPINAVKYVGAFPVFMDCDDYLNIDVYKTRDFLENECRYKNGKLINRTSGKQIKAILPVHVFGNPVDMVSLVKLANKYELSIIEDATESLGSYYSQGKYNGRMTGSIGDFGCLSFNGNKIITCGGGGMILTNSSKLAEKAGYLTTQAKDDSVRFIHNEIGYNYRLSNIQAAMGVAQIERLPSFIKRKKKNYNLYKKGLADIPGLTLLGSPDGSNPNYWFYSLFIDPTRFGLDREGVMKRLDAVNIQTRPLWYPNHLQKPYRNCQSYQIEKAIWYWQRVLNLPCSVGLQHLQVKRVVSALQEMS